MGVGGQKWTFLYIYLCKNIRYLSIENSSELSVFCCDESELSVMYFLWTLSSSGSKYSLLESSKLGDLTDNCLSWKYKHFYWRVDKVTSASVDNYTDFPSHSNSVRLQIPECSHCRQGMQSLLLNPSPPRSQSRPYQEECHIQWPSPGLRLGLFSPRYFPFQVCLNGSKF